MENKTAIQLLKSSLIEVSKSMKSVSIEGLMMSMDDLEKLEQENIVEAYHQGRYSDFIDGEEYYNETHKR
jgi:hypothetical protein